MNDTPLPSRVTMASCPFCGLYDVGDGSRTHCRACGTRLHVLGRDIPVAEFYDIEIPETTPPATISPERDAEDAAYAEEQRRAAEERELNQLLEEIDRDLEEREQERRRRERERIEEEERERAEREEKRRQEEEEAKRWDVTAITDVSNPNKAGFHRRRE